MADQAMSLLTEFALFGMAIVVVVAANRWRGRK